MLLVLLLLFYFFFFSSRRRHTRLTCDWSSDVCSSDLCCRAGAGGEPRLARRCDRGGVLRLPGGTIVAESSFQLSSYDRGSGSLQRWRSEERRVGKECRFRGAPQR